MKRNCRTDEQSGYSASRGFSFFFTQNRGSGRLRFRVVRRSLETVGTRKGISSAFFLAVIFCSLCLVTAAQSPTEGTPVQGAPSAPPAAAGLLRPALDQVQQTVGSLNVEKWKKGSVRDEAGDHIRAILRDMHTTLPPLLDTAAASPGTISKMLPVSRNIAALYDVLLSVVEAARISGSGEDSTRLQQALSAADLEKQEIDLRTTLQAREAVKCVATPPPATPACPAPAPVRKAKRIPKPPATPPQPSTPPANSTPKTQN
jgi:hypothetical protein